MRTRSNANTSRVTRFTLLALCVGASLSPAHAAVLDIDYDEIEMHGFISKTTTPIEELRRSVIDLNRALLSTSARLELREAQKLVETAQQILNKKDGELNEEDLDHVARQLGSAFKLVDSIRKEEGIEADEQTVLAALAVKILKTKRCLKLIFPDRCDVVVICSYWG